MKTFKTLLAGASALFLAMGAARFAFTPHLPLMQKDFMFNDTMAGFLASANYLGYLTGSILSIKISRFKNTYGIFVFIIWLSVLLICGMYFHNYFSWIILRFFSGLLSALIFVLCLIMVLDYLSRTETSHLSGIIYIGIGLGMAVSGFSLPMLYKYFNSSELWLCLGFMAVIPASFSMMIPRRVHHESHEKHDVKYNKKAINLLYLSYFLEGLGYIVTATFISVIVLRNTGSVILSGNVWIIAGLSAMLITPLWPLIARKIGTANSLALLYFIQAVAISIPVLSNKTIPTMIGAIGFGGTFLGIVILSLIFGRKIHPGGKTTALLTTYLSIGQIIGPVAAGFLSDYSGSFKLPVLLASALVFLGGIVVLLSSSALKNRAVMDDQK